MLVELRLGGWGLWMVLADGCHTSFLCPYYTSSLLVEFERQSIM